MFDFIEDKFKKSLSDNSIDTKLYDVYNVKRGLRNADGTGVLVALTKISDVHGYILGDRKKIADDGHLYYRGIDIYDLMIKDTFGYEKVCYLILFGHLPSDKDLFKFHEILSEEYNLPNEFLENHILKNPSKNLMNLIQRAVLALYSFDDDPDNTDPMEVLKKGIALLAKMPAIICYSLQAKKHYIDNESLTIHHPNKDYSIAENILYLSRNNGEFTKLEAETLDLSLIIHADHGGGNNSTFVNVVIGSTATDIYSAISGSLGSLKGPRHGGANSQVEDMMETIINDISFDATDEEITKIINKILDKKYFDNSGLIYGIGHAIYSLSDPRAILLKEKCRELSKMKNQEKAFSFYERLEQIAINELKKRKGEGFNCCANVDFYSGLTYKLLNIPRDLFTPIFATARVVGWLAHNIEHKLSCNKIIRPATKYVGEINKK